MTTARSAYRAAIGKAIGRRYYASGTTSGTSTVNEVVDATRTEFPAEWDGSSIYFASVTSPNSAIVRGGDPTGRIFLDSDLGSIPAPSAAYEMFKGFTKQDRSEEHTSELQSP